MKKKTRLRIACIQLNASNNWKKNWTKVQKQLLQAVNAGAEVALLPENFIARATESEMNQIADKVVPRVLAALQIFSKKNHIAVISGSVPEKLGRQRSRKPQSANTCSVFSSKGKIVLSYQKMHLFDVDLPGVSVQESRSVRAGKQPGFFKVDGIAAGVGICYDLRFPEYFRALSQQGAEILFVPANFTAATGETAWEVLLRARAIENQCYVVAAGQWGRHPASGIASYGNSMVIDPLGRVMKRASFARSEVLIVDLDLKLLRDYRKCFPVLKHRKIL